MFLEELFKDGYCCARCELVVSLEAQILDLENQVATLRRLNNLKRSLDITQQMLAGTSTEEG